MKTMNLEDFTKIVTELVAKSLPDKEINVQDFTKNNGVTLKGMVIIEKDNPVAPTIYLNQFYEQCEKESEMNDIVKNIVAIYQSNKDAGLQGFEFSSLMDYAKIRDQLRFKVINYDKNIKQYQNMPHRQILDLMVVYYINVNVGDADKGQGSITVSKALFDKWGITEDELWNTALLNTAEHEKVTVASMADVMNEILGEQPVSDTDVSLEEQMDMADGIPMIVVTNRTRVNGAGVIMYPDCLAKIRNDIHSDFYILPSSTHEVLVIPKRYGIHAEELLEMVREVNATQVSVDERLSDNIYCYEDGELKLIAA